MGKYSFLKDPRALAEIRKHRLKEIERAGCEVGFATAAVDWVKKHGEEWMKNCILKKEGGKEGSPCFLSCPLKGFRDVPQLKQ